MRRCWMAVASAEHVRIGRAQGFMQVCHGKPAPLRRLAEGDGVVYYSPARRMGERTPLRALTAIGTVLARPPYQVQMQAGFAPFRRDVQWCEASETPIAALLPELELAAGEHWGARLRFGLLQISARDFDRIADAMGARAGASRDAPAAVPAGAILLR
jgi:hypothetical protein